MTCLPISFRRGLAWISSAAGPKSSVTPPGPGTALHAACASRWHRLDPARAGGLTEVARLLLDAGADPAVTAPPFARPDEPGRQWSPLLCAVAGEPNPAITRLLLDHGARPDDHVLYLAAFDAGHECLQL